MFFAYNDSRQKIEGKFLLKGFPMSKICSNTSNNALQNLLSFSKKFTRSGASFSELVDTASIQTQNTAQDANFLVNFYAYATANVGSWAYSPLVFDTVTTTTITSTASLLNDESVSSMPKKAFVADLGVLSKEQLEAISKDLSLADESEQAKLAEAKLKTIFFRDAKSFEFQKSTLSEETIKALQEEFGEDSFLQREDGSILLSAKAEKFVSGWQKALSEASKEKEQLDELINKDKNFDGALDSSELDSFYSFTSTQTTTITTLAWAIWFVPSNAVLVDSSLVATFKSLHSGFAFDNLSTADRTSLEQIFPELFGKNLQNESEQSATQEFNKAKFNEYYQKLSEAFKTFSASFMSLSKSEEAKLNFETLSDIVLEMGKNISKSDSMKV